MMKSKTCPYCTFDEETDCGTDRCTGHPVDLNYSDEIMDWTGMDFIRAIYLRKVKHGAILVNDEPDNEGFLRAIVKIKVSYCPWCGRKL
jgi:hypothetical protein